MIVKRGKGDFYQVYRPCKLSEVAGNDEVKTVIENAFKENTVPHTFLFHGLSGTGKTTIARIIEMGLNCAKGPTSEPCCECDYCKRIINRSGSLAVREINAVDVVKDGLRNILRDFNAYNSGAFEGLEKNIFLVDECHGLTPDQAGLFLKYIEDVPEWNYFVFCTTDPNKVLHTLKNRCVIQVEFNKVSGNEIMKLLFEICEQERIYPDKEILKGIVEKSNGMPRNAVNELQKNCLIGNFKKKNMQALSDNNNILLIAPHGHPEDDKNTANLGINIAEKLNCQAIVNDSISRSHLDFNIIKEASKHKQFIPAIENAVKIPGLTLVVWIHGIGEDNLKTEIQKLGVKEDVQCLIGYGQGKPKRFTAEKKTVDGLIKTLKNNSVIAHVAKDGSNYCGHSTSLMNQWFRSKGYKLTDVQSVQLEFKYQGIRDPESLEKASQKIANSLSELMIQSIEAGMEFEDRSEAESALVSEPSEDARNHMKRLLSLSLDDKLPKIGELRKLEPPQLIDLQGATQNRINKLYDALNLYQKKLGKISSVLNQKDMAKETYQKAKRGFRDWTEPENNINFCTGCENNCVYCFAKFMAYHRRQVKEGHWHEMIIRGKDVDKKRKLHKGIVGFPSTHDILPINIEAYLIVLGKLLRSGNEVLVVSKPRFDCIKCICEAAQFFRDKILFRFTIGAMNDGILSFWEPNAPSYDERKKCLKYAFNMGFRTSVSMEPMLDSRNIEALIEDLLQFVSEDIWLGTMNHISRIKKGADERLLPELKNIEHGQTTEKLLAIDKIYENNPKIKWKSEALKIIEAAKESQKNSLEN